jgi:hypothetical protein
MGQNVVVENAPDPESALRRELIKRELRRSEAPPRFVLFIDMLGFSQLTEDNPKPLVYDFESRDFYVAETSESAKQLGRFQQVLNRFRF